MVGTCAIFLFIRTTSGLDRYEYEYQFSKAALLPAVRATKRHPILLRLPFSPFDPCHHFSTTSHNPLFVKKSTPTLLVGSSNTCSSMPCTPLLLLLDGVLSQDEDRISQAITQIIDEAKVPLEVEAETEGISHRLLSSALALEQIVAQLMLRKPEWARIASRRDGSLPLHFAASIGSIPLARLILNANRKAALTPNQKGKTPLHYAAREGRVDMVEFFMMEVPETASIRSKKDKLALHFAAGEGHFGVVQALLKANPGGASLPSKKGKVAIHFAARWGHVQIAQALLAISPETISALDYEGSSAFHDAAREGQVEMMKFLVQQYPQGLKQVNLRGETPLVPAIRSGNLELVTLMIHAWPEGGKHLLQRVREYDNVNEWNSGILEICLRGAVNILTSTEEEEEEEKESSCTEATTTNTSSSVSKVSNETAATALLLASMKAAQLFIHDNTSTKHPSDGNTTPPLMIEKSGGCPEQQQQGLDIHLPRSKSPILEQARGGGANKKHKRKDSSSSLSLSSRKRPRPDGPSDDDEKGDHDGSGDDLFSELRATSQHRSFHELHAALQCGVSAPVLNCVLDRHGESQIDVTDELGRMPLHIAMEASSSPRNRASSVVDMILERIWKPYPEACSHRDYLGRLPLHHALMHRADAKLVQALLLSNPCSGVEHCDVLDEQFMDKLPLEMALTFGCDMSTIYMLLRADPSLISTFEERSSGVLSP